MSRCKGEEEMKELIDYHITTMIDIQVIYTFLEMNVIVI